jgi:hypothetical protein
MGMLQTIETLSGRPVEFKPDSSLSLRATLQLARNGAHAHMLRYRVGGCEVARKSGCETAFLTQAMRAVWACRVA